MTQRGFIYLTLIAAFSVLLALGALRSERKTNLMPPPQKLLPELTAQLDNVQNLRITHGLGLSGVMTLTFERRGKQWILLTRNYPANQELVNETLLALAQLEGLEARTKRRKWHATLGLTLPDALGAAIRFQLADAQGQILADILLGNNEQSEAEAILPLASPLQASLPPQQNFFIRHFDDPQTWLGRGRLPRSRKIAAWIDPNWHSAAAVTESQLEKITISAGGKTHIGFDGKWGGIETIDAKWYQAFMQLRPVDVAPARQFDFSDALRISVHDKGGAQYQYDVLGLGDSIFVTRDAGEAHAGAAQAFQFNIEARAILLPSLSR